MAERKPQRPVEVGEQHLEHRVRSTTLKTLEVGVHEQRDRSVLGALRVPRRRVLPGDPAAAARSMAQRIVVREWHEPVTLRQDGWFLSRGAIDMFIGHYSVSFAAKRADPLIPLWVLFIAVQLLNVLWAPFVF